MVMKINAGDAVLEMLKGKMVKPIDYDYVFTIESGTLYASDRDRFETVEEYREERLAVLGLADYFEGEFEVYELPAKLQSLL